MTRRSCLAMAVAGVAAGLAAVSGSPAGYGYMTVDRARQLGINARTRVYLDGRDITAAFNIREAHDREGWVVVLDRNAAGGYYLDASGNLARKRLYGRVELKVAPHV